MATGTDIGSLYTKIEADTSGLDKAEGKISKFAKRAGAMLATAFVAKKAWDIAKAATFATARFDTMGVVMEQVGKTAGYSATQMAEYEKSVRATGISMIKTRETLTKIAQAQIDMNKATELGRIAQNAAVIGNIDSSEAFNRMITSMRNGSTIMLRTIGINVNFQNAYSELAAQLGKTSMELTNYEKVQARTNAVLKEGAKIQGVYEAAMGSAGKKWLSLKRHISDTTVKLGRMFQPAFGRAVDGITDSIKNFSKSIDPAKIKAWGNTIDTVTEKIIRFAEVSGSVGFKNLMKITLVTAAFLKYGKSVGLVSGVIIGLDSQMSKLGVGLSDLPKKYKDITISIQNVIDGLSGKKDFHTGEIIGEIEQIENKIQELKNFKEPWQIFPDPFETRKQADKIKSQIEKLEKDLAGRRSAIAKKSLSALEKLHNKRAESAEKSTKKEGRSLKTLQKAYKKHTKVLRKIQEDFRTSQLDYIEEELQLRIELKGDEAGRNLILDQVAKIKKEAATVGESGIDGWRTQVKLLERAKSLIMQMSTEAKTISKAEIAAAKKRFLLAKRAVERQSTSGTRSAYAKALSDYKKLVKARKAGPSEVEEQNKIKEKLEEVKALNKQILEIKKRGLDEEKKYGNALIKESDFVLADKLYKDIGETYKAVFTEAQKASSEAVKLEVIDVKDLGAEIIEIEGIYINVFNAAVQASAAATKKMINDVTRLKNAQKSSSSKSKLEARDTVGAPLNSLLGRQMTNLSTPTTAPTTESVRNYYITGQPSPISVKANDDNANKLLQVFQRKYKSRSGN